MKKQTYLPVVLLASACASDPPTEDEIADLEYHRDVTRIEAAEEFEKKKAACAARGRVTVVRRVFSRRIRSSTPEVGLVTCLSSRPPVIF